MTGDANDIPARIMGIDYGTTRLGISLSDPLLILAQPHQTIPNNKHTVAAISDIIEREQVALVVVGMPFNLKGEKGKKAEEVEKFVGSLTAAIKAKVITWDERFTTLMAHQTMRKMGTRRKQREQNKGRIDAMAASLLLQNYLDSRKRSLSC